MTARKIRPCRLMTDAAALGTDLCRHVTCVGRPSSLDKGSASHESAGINVGVAGFLQSLVCNQAWSFASRDGLPFRVAVGMRLHHAAQCPSNV